MPNVVGLMPADALLSAYSGTTPKTIDYGPHCTVTLDPNGASIATRQGTLLAMVTNLGVPRARLDRIDGDTVTPVNAFLRPFGKVKVYWRTGEYRWHPANGTPTAPTGKVAAPVAAPVTTPVTPVAAPSVAAPTPVAHPATSGGVIETVRRWQDLRKKRPVVKPGIKGYVLADDVLVPGSDIRVLDAMKAKRDAGMPAFGLITGPAGTAKTRLAQAWAFVNDLPVVVIDGMSIQTATDWYGMTLPKADGGFEWVWSDAAKLILTGQPCLIILDELNRPENERALNGIMPLTDWKATAKPMGAPHAITLQPGQCVIATLNEGIEYVGTVEVDAAVRDRFGGHGVRMGYAVETVESSILRQQVPGLDRDVAKRLVRIAAGQRAKRDDDTLYPSHNTISTRSLVGVAQSIVIAGMDPKEALWGDLKARFWPEDFTALTTLIEAQFGVDAVTEDEDDDSALDEDEVEQMLSGE